MGAIGSSLTTTPALNNTTRTSFNVTILVANTEQSQALPSNTKGYIIKTRGSASLKLTHVSGQSGTNFITVPPRAVYTDDNFYTSDTLYFQSPTAGDVVEIVAFS